MKTCHLLYFCACLVLTACSSAPQTKSVRPSQAANSKFEGGKTDAGRMLPNKLRYIPFGITVWHDPNPCYAVFEDSTYKWKHSTSVMSKEDLQLVEYGSFIFTKKGWYLRIAMDAKEFEVTYHCKDSRLKANTVYTDSSSQRFDDSLYAGDALWYFLAKDRNGNLVKGIGPIETEGRLKKASDETTNAYHAKDGTLQWTGYAEVGKYSLKGDVSLSEAVFSFQGDTLCAARILIDLESIRHKEASLVAHLKDSDFFDVGKFPTAAFIAEQITYNNSQQSMVTGLLTIKGISHRESFPVTTRKSSGKKIIEGKLVIDRTKYNIRFNSSSFFDNLGDKAIKNSFDLEFKLLLEKSRI